MRFSALVLIMAAMAACGGSQDVCQQGLSLIQAESDRVKSCGGDNTALEIEVATIKSEEQNCEAGLKNCSSSELKALQDAVSCQQSADATIQCKWFTEPDTNSDASFQTYKNASQSCSDKINDVSPACRGDT